MATGESDIGGIPLGQKGTLVKTPLEALQEKGVRVAKATIINVRGGWNSGDVIRHRFLCAEKLSQDDASLKNTLYLTIANQAVELRTPQARYAHRFNTNNYMEALAKQLRKDQHDVARLIRAMRADLVSTDPDNQDQDLITLFLGLTERYIRDYSGPYPSSAHPPIKFLDQNWNHVTIKDFYRVLSSQGVRAVTTWVPYEMEIMARFYDRQITHGNRLTPFDKTVLLGVNSETTSDKDRASQIRSESGVNVGHNVIEAHRNSLVYGSPESVLIARKS